MTTETIIRLIDGWSAEIIQFTGELIATPSETPTGDERKITKLLSDKLDQLGLTGALVTSDVPEHPNPAVSPFRKRRRSDTALRGAH